MQGINVLPPPTPGAEPAGLDAAVAAVMGGQAPAIVRPDPYSDTKALTDLHRRLKQEAYDQRWVFERLWWRNLLYDLNRQWIYYDTTRGQYQDKRLARWVPRPVTNKIAETKDAILSVFQSVQLGVNCAPDGQDPRDITTAETMNRLSTPIHFEHGMDQVQAAVDYWLILTGNAFVHPWWDKRRERQIILVNLESCALCGNVYDPAQIQAAGGMCPGCGSPALQQAIGQDGQPLTKPISFGSGCTDACSPFEIAAPLHYADLRDSPFLYRARFRPKAWYEKNAPDVAGKLNWEKSSSDKSIQLLRSLATQTDLGASPTAFTGGGGELMAEGATEYELWQKPSREYPEGLVMRVVECGGAVEILELADDGMPGPLPYKTAKGEPIFPWIHLRYEKIGGRLWGRSPIDRLIQKQDQINQLDSMIQMIVQRVANPIWLEPKGAEVKRFTGEPGLVVKYNPLVAGGNAKPEKIEGSNVPVSLFKLREMYLADMENLAGTYDVIKGQKPSGVEAFSALQLLVERSQTRYGPVLAERGEAYRTWFSVAIELERQYGPVDRVWSSLGPNNGWTFQEFQNADLQGAVRIMVEDGSQTPKTSLGKRAAIEQLRNLGVINPQEPDTAYRILEVFGQTDLFPGLDTDVKSALQEQDEFERWAQSVQLVPPPVDPLTGQPPMQVDPATGAATPMGPRLSTTPPGTRKPWHNDVVHLAQHRKWANSDRMRKLLAEKPYLEAIVGWMLQQHEFMLMQQAMAQAAAQAGPSPGGLAMGNSNRESGNPGDEPRGQAQQPNAGPQQQGPQ